MSFEINIHLSEHIDKEGQRLLTLLKVRPAVKVTAHLNPEGDSEPIDLSEDELIFKSYSEHQETIEMFCYGKEGTFGFSEEEYTHHKKLIDTIYKDKTLSSLVSISFVDQHVFQWIIKTHTKQIKDENLSSYLVTQINTSLREYIIHFPIPFLELGKELKIGEVEFGSFTESYFENYEKHFKSIFPNRANPYGQIARDLSGTVFARYRVKAEQNQAVATAFKECALAVDVLKICSDTLVKPLLKLSFDIDSRIKESDKNQIVIQHLRFEDGINLSSSTQSRPCIISEEAITTIQNKRGLKYLDEFLLGLQPNRTELQNLLVTAIAKFSAALSNTILHQRVADLFTILESLLTDAEQPILESVCKYGSKLIYKEKEKRKSFIALVKKLYQVRSAWVHHAVEKSIDANELKFLQTSVMSLILTLSVKSKVYKTKNDLITEIDDAILGAYDL
jgi:hypothetical protein